MVNDIEVESVTQAMVEGLDAAEVKALFGAIRALPGSLASLRETYDRVKERLTPCGRAAYQRELQKLLGDTSPAELLDGEYALVVRSGEDGESLAALHCQHGRITIDVRIADPLLSLGGLVVDAAGCIEAWLLRVQEGEELTAKIDGRLELRDGFLFLEATIAGQVECVGPGSRHFSHSIHGTGDGRPARA